MVQALEDGDLNNLPGRTYEIGYIKLICRTTKTNPETIINKWVNEYYSQKEKDPYVFPEATFPKERSVIVTFGPIISLLIIAAYAGWYLYSINNPDISETKIKEDNVNINLLTQYNQDLEVDNSPKVIENENSISDKDNKLASDVLNDQDNVSEVSVIEDNVSEVSVIEDNLSEILDIEDNLSEASLNMEKLIIDEGIENITNSYNISIYENFTFVGIEDSWVQIISSEGEMFFTGMVKKDHNLLVPNNEKLLITLGNAGAIGIDIIEAGVKPIGQNGEIIQAVKLGYILEKISYTDQNNQ
jgi:cytoskeletal protein RodZ